MLRVGHCFRPLFHRVQNITMAKKKSKVKGRSFKSSKKRAYNGRGPSNKPKHSKVAKLKKLAKMRAQKSKTRKAAVKGKKKKKR